MQQAFCNALRHMKTTILPLKHSMNLSPVRLALLLIPLALVCFALSPQARATCQQGCFTIENTVLGDNALMNNTGSNDTAIGANTLMSNISGFNNTAIGSGALFSNTSGNNNTATGLAALIHNTSGFNNTANGYFALGASTGNFNTATGANALYSNTTGNNNTATGLAALFNNTTASRNTANGSGALLKNTTGSGNIALGAGAGENLTTGDDNIDIGNRGVVADANTIRIGRQQMQTATFIAGISGVSVPTGVAVIIDTTGHLGTTTSSARYKESIQPMDKASEAILALKPVTFRYKHELDPDGIPQFGLVAEEVEKVNPDLVARDEQGKPYTVRYDAVNAMLLNEFLKEHRTVTELKKEIAALTATVKQQSAQIQKVNAQLETSKPAPQVVLNP
jgi:hypothetical protein